MREKLEPQPPSYVSSLERGLDPWHPDAFVGTPTEGKFPSMYSGPRKEMWLYVDAHGNVVGTHQPAHPGERVVKDQDGVFWFEVASGEENDGC